MLPDIDNKKFVEKCKQIFGSSHARLCNDIYINVIPDKLLFINSTTPPKGKDEEPIPGDKLMAACAGELAAHALHIKDEEFKKAIQQWLLIPDDQFYRMANIRFLSIINKYPLKQLRVCWKNDKLFLTPNDLSENFCIVFPTKDFHVNRALRHLATEIEVIGTESFDNTYPHLWLDITEKPNIVKNEYKLNIALNQFTLKDKQCFKNVNCNCRLFCRDGISSVSWIRYIKNTKSSNFQMKLYAWYYDRVTICNMFMFEDDTIDVKSLRPNVFTVPMSSIIDLDYSDLLSLDIG